MRSLWILALVGLTFASYADFRTTAALPANAADPPEYLPICNLPKCLNPRVTAKSGIGTANASAEAKVTPEDAAKWCATYKPMDKLCPTEQVKSGWIGFRNLYRASADCVAGRMTGIDGNGYVYAGVWEDGPGKGRARFASSNPRFPAKKWDESGVEVHPSGSITGWGGGSPNLAAQWEVLCAGAQAPTAAQPVSQVPQAAASVSNAVQVRSSELQQFATETPLVSAQFGTAEATAKIAVKSGFIDVVGVKLGSPLKAAIEALKAHNPNLTIDPQSMAPYEALPGVVMTPLLTSKKNTNTASSQKEYVGLLVTFAPNDPFVWGMWRELWYEKEEDRPTIETVVAGLRSKYGQESLKDVGTRLIWMYDAQGQQLKETQTRDIMNKCRWKLEGNSMLVTYYNREVVGGYYHSSYGKDPFNGLCQSYALVEAEYMAQTPLVKTSPPLVTTVKVYASNHQLEVSGVTASHTHLMNEATKLAEQRKGEAAKREIPKF